MTINRAIAIVILIIAVLAAVKFFPNEYGTVSEDVKELARDAKDIVR